MKADEESKSRAKLNVEIQKFLEDRYRSLYRKTRDQNTIGSKVQAIIDKKNGIDADSVSFPSLSYKTFGKRGRRLPRKTWKKGDSFDCRSHTLNQNGTIIVVDVTAISELSAFERSCLDDWDQSKVDCFLRRRVELNCCDDTSTLGWWERPLWAWKRDELVIGHGAMASVDMTATLRRALPSSSFLKLVVSNLADIPIDCFQEHLPFQLILHPQSTLKERQNDQKKTIEKPVIDLKEEKSATVLSMDFVPETEMTKPQPHTPPQKATPASEASFPSVDTRSRGGEASSISELPAIDCNDAKKGTKDVMDESNANEDCTPTTQLVDTETATILSASPTSVVQQISPLSQLDSQGVDLAMLSRLPLALRSEARLAFAIQDKKREKKRHTPCTNSPLYQWLSTASSSSTPHNNSTPTSTSARPTKKRNQTIKEFFA
eukprot:scaffold4637_cov128-Cylindrotheca_fusiformis.AAC.2